LSRYPQQFKFVVSLYGESYQPFASHEFIGFPSILALAQQTFAHFNSSPF